MCDHRASTSSTRMQPGDVMGESHQYQDQNRAARLTHKKKPRRRFISQGARVEVTTGRERIFKRTVERSPPPPLLHRLDRSLARSRTTTTTTVAQAPPTRGIDQVPYDADAGLSDPCASARDSRTGSMMSAQLSSLLFTGLPLLLHFALQQEQMMCAP